MAEGTHPATVPSTEAQTSEEKPSNKTADVPMGDPAAEAVERHAKDSEGFSEGTLRRSTIKALCTKALSCLQLPIQTALPSTNNPNRKACRKSLLAHLVTIKAQKTPK